MSTQPHTTSNDDPEDPSIVELSPQNRDSTDQPEPKQELELQNIQPEGRDSKTDRSPDNTEDSKSDENTLNESQILTERSDKHVSFHMGHQASNKAALQIPCFLIAITILVCFLFFKVVSVFHQDHAYDLASIQSEHHIIFSHLSKPPLTNITSIHNNGSCPHGYAHLMLGEWFGMHKGCHCKDANLVEAEVCHQNCKDIEQIPPIKKKTFTTWKNGEQLCGRHTAYHIPNQRKCRHGYKVCDDGTCYSEHDGCPLTKFSLENRTITVSKSLIGFELLHLEEQLCFNPQYSVQKHTDLYPLDVSRPEGCGTLGTYQWTEVLANISGYELLKQNGIMADKLPQLPLLKNEIYQLVGIYAMQFKTSEGCSEIHPESFLSWHGEYESLKSAVGFIQLTCALGVFVSLLMYVVIFFEHYKLHGSFKSVFSVNLESEAAKITSDLIFFALLPVLSVLEVIVVLILKAPLDFTYHQFSRIVENRCFLQDNFYPNLKVYTNFHEKDIESLLQLSLIMVLLAVIMLVLYITSRRSGKGPYISINTSMTE